MTVSDTILKRINTLEQFARNKAKILTDKKVTLDIVIDLRNESGQKTLGRIFIHRNTKAKKYYYQIKILDEAFERLPLSTLKNIILHELSHIAGYEKIINNKSSTPASSHGSEFKKACTRMGTPKKFACAHPHVEKPKRRIVKLI